MTTPHPNITISTLDMERLEALIDKLPNNFPGKSTLEAELLRADVLEPQDMPAHVVTMNSTIRFTLIESGESQTLHLVYPKDHEAGKGQVSVFAPVGTALLGLSVGQTFELPSPAGKSITVRVDEITYQPESAGERHR